MKLFTSELELEPIHGDWNLGKAHSLPIEIIHLVLELNEAHHRKNSVREKVIGKKWII